MRTAAFTLAFALALAAPAAAIHNKLFMLCGVKVYAENIDPVACATLPTDSPLLKATNPPGATVKFDPKDKCHPLVKTCEGGDFKKATLEAKVFQVEKFKCTVENISPAGSKDSTWLVHDHRTNTHAQVQMSGEPPEECGELSKARVFFKLCGVEVLGKYAFPYNCKGLRKNDMSTIRTAFKKANVVVEFSPIERCFPQLALCDSGEFQKANKPNSKHVIGVDDKDPKRCTVRLIDGGGVYGSTWLVHDYGTNIWAQVVLNFHEPKECATPLDIDSMLFVNPNEFGDD